MLEPKIFTDFLKLNVYKKSAMIKNILNWFIFKRIERAKGGLSCLLIIFC